MRAPDDRKGVALLILDRAECRLRAGNPDGAAHDIASAARLAAQQLVAPIQARIVALREQLSPWSATTWLQELDNSLQDLHHPTGGTHDALARSQHTANL